LKKIFSFLILILLFFLIINYREKVVSFILKEFIYKNEIAEFVPNQYFYNKDYDYVKLTDDFIIKNKDDIKNTIYTVLNGGVLEFNLYCDEEYLECLDDFEKMSTDYDVLANINNLVHPYNSYNELYISTNSFGKINIKVSKLYSDSEIEEINLKIEQIKQNIITDDMSTREKIRAFHDYIINNTKYDVEMSTKLMENPNVKNVNNSNKANGVLNNNLALCSGYTDLMAIFLSSINIPNYKISTEQHIWNAIFVDNNWYHLDLTWDDPITNTFEDLLIHDFFLITTSELEQKDTSKHNYNKTVYGI